MTDHRPSLENLAAERVNEMSRNFWNSAMLRAGIKLNVFSLLQHQALSCDDVAQACDANRRFMEAFLEACVALGLLDKQDGRYTDSAQAAAFLVPDKPAYVGDLVLHITNYWHTWGKLDQLIKEGRTELPFENGFVDAPTYWTDYMRGQHNRATAGQGDYLVQSVALDGRRKMLDLGGGAASYSLALCAANPALHADVVDQVEPLAVARPLVEAAGLQDRITLVPGDFNTVELASDYDVVLISGVVLIKSEAGCRAVFRRALAALQPGGLVIVQDFMRVDHSAARSFLDTMMDMYVVVAFDPGAGDRFGDEVAGWLVDEGFTNTRQIPLPTHLALVLADKP